jgi:hypothetical protein
MNTSMPAYRTAIMDKAKRGSGRLVITYSNGRRNMDMIQRTKKPIDVPAVGDVVTETHGYDYGTAIIPPPVIKEKDRDKVQITWRCVAQTVIFDPRMVMSLVVTWQCEAVEWIMA